MQFVSLFTLPIPLWILFFLVLHLNTVFSLGFSDLERSFALLNVSGPIDPFSIELISQLLIHIGYPKKHHLIGLQRFDVDAPALHTNSTVKLGEYQKNTWHFIIFFVALKCTIQDYIFLPMNVLDQDGCTPLKKGNQL